jgi:hypothetical protein
MSHRVAGGTSSRSPLQVRCWSGRTSPVGGSGAKLGGPLLDAVRGEVELTVLRPPAFGSLREAVRQAADADSPFHVVHFDGHGAMLRSASGGEGVLVFETAENAAGQGGVGAHDRPGPTAATAPGARPATR